MLDDSGHSEKSGFLLNFSYFLVIFLRISCFFAIFVDFSQLVMVFIGYLLFFQHSPAHISELRGDQSPFSSGGRIVFGKNDKHKVSELRKQLNELKVEFLALILVPFRAPNSQ